MVFLLVFTLTDKIGHINDNDRQIIIPNAIDRLNCGLNFIDRQNFRTIEFDRISILKVLAIDRMSFTLTELSFGKVAN